MSEVIKLTEAQKKVLAATTENLQEIGAIMDKSSDCRADTRLLQLKKKDLVEYDYVHRPGRRRRWMAYKLTDEGIRVKKILGLR